MSYCVHCGVELAPSERVCPLCKTEVIDPKNPYDPEAPKPFPEQTDPLSRHKRWPFVLLITLVLLLPSAVCLACDLAYSGGGWSMLVIGAMAFLWLLTVPLLFRSRHPILRHMALSTAALLGYLWLIEWYSHGRWFTPLALPIVLLLAMLIGAEYRIMRRLRDTLACLTAAFLGIPLLVVGIEIAVDLFLTGAVSLLWSWIVSIPCVLLAAVCLLLCRQTRLRAELHKRLFM